jgi:hypothetical protein
MFCISYRRNGSSLYPRWAVSRSRQSGRYDKSEVTDDRHRPALAETRDLAVLAQRIFQTPVAFLALLDHTEQVTARIGIGEEWWSVIEGFPLRRAFEDAPIAPDTAQWLPEGCNAGGLGFFAATPVRSCTGMPLGLLILANYAPGHGFPEADRQALRTLVNAFTANMEPRAMASHALEGELRWLETEKRFRAIANSAAVLIIYGGPDAPRCSSTTGGWNSPAGACRKRWEMAGATVSIPNTGRLCARPSRGPLKSARLLPPNTLAAKGWSIPLDARPRGAAVFGEWNVPGLRS